ncbi:MAG: tetratricopeptide repeat protein, partial [Spirochaetaceae bacterium]|nr:tetratricopeptide repeat protein [Spirochaetaceae bacterium]
DGRLGPAETEFRLALAAEPYCPALINLGNVCFLRREFDAAAEYYRQAIDIDPESSLALLGLVRTCYELEQYGELDRYMVQLVALDPTRAEAVSHLGTVGASTDRSSAAVNSAIGGWDE